MKDDTADEAEMPERREFLIRAVKGLGLAASGGLLWGGYIKEGISAPLTLRPPGAIEEEKFIATCMKCGMCVEACPYDTLKLAEPGDDIPVGTPYFIPRSTPCFMCTDIPCVPACPSGSLDSKLVSEQDKNGEYLLNINLARIGLAVIDRETCVAYSGIQCDACYRACPLIDRAITTEYLRNARTGKHAMLVPDVHSDYCTGCGLCEKACITDKASIFVLPRKIAMGKAGSTYIPPSVKRRAEIETPGSAVGTVFSGERKNPVDYLNEDSF
jgi:ferredoxin-type protein NapG